MAGTEPIVQHSAEWLAVADPEAIRVAYSQGGLDVLLGARELADGEALGGPQRPVQRDQSWLVANKSDAAEVVRAMAAGELDDLLGRSA